MATSFRLGVTLPGSMAGGTVDRNRFRTVVATLLYVIGCDNRSGRVIGLLTAITCCDLMDRID
jgi:hypothetical protein